MRTRPLLALLLLGVLVASPARAQTAITQFVCMAKATVGSGLTHHLNVASVTRTGVGAYIVTLQQAGPRSDGIAAASISLPWFIHADFADASHIAVTIWNTSGVQSDPPNGTIIALRAWQ